MRDPSAVTGEAASRPAVVTGSTGAAPDGAPIAAHSAAETAVTAAITTARTLYFVVKTRNSP
ncbi:hypothetical protein NWFMUON74_18310 [Nocardia wallacei]|uniref:Uncharacterized protein n=1 Tax=Nocardia wallacei TaxID=480035 RepID=A0A7G1KJC6_9NOCA|nr:hypothetical protein NWFMUON74_18310 [Nocardia wallacei]